MQKQKRANPSSLFSSLFAKSEQSNRSQPAAEVRRLGSLFFSGHLSNKPLHPVGAVALHLLRHVPVDVECEGCGVVPEVCLHGFDVVAGAQRRDGVRVTQIVESGMGNAGLRGKRLELEVNGLGAEIPAVLLREDEVHGIAPAAAHGKPGFVLCDALLTQNVKHEVGRGNDARLAVFPPRRAPKTAAA